MIDLGGLPLRAALVCLFLRVARGCLDSVPFNLLFEKVRRMILRDDFAIDCKAASPARDRSRSVGTFGEA